MNEWCEKHGTEWHTAIMFNTLTLTLNQVWHHVIITNCHSIHHKHCKRLSRTIKLIKWCHTNQNGQFYIEPCNRWVQYSWLAQPNNPSSVITWKFHCCFHITRADTHQNILNQGFKSSFITVIYLYYKCIQKSLYHTLFILYTVVLLSEYSLIRRPQSAFYFLAIKKWALEAILRFDTEPTLTCVLSMISYVCCQCFLKLS